MNAQRAWAPSDWDDDIYALESFDQAFGVVQALEAFGKPSNDSSLQYTIKTVFDEAGHDLIVDNRLAARIARYRSGFVNKNDDHIEFFGGNLLGVQVVRHTRTDRAVFFEDVLGMDENDLKNKIIKTDLVEADYKRVSDPYNSAALYLLYRLMNAPKLPQKVRDQAMIDVVFMLQAKLLTSLLSHWFEHPASVEEAKATYAQLSMKYGLKQYGSWNAYLTNRSETFLQPDGIHMGVVRSFAPDKMILYAITEPQDRLREVVKGMYQEFLDVRKNGSRIRSTSTSLELDGEMVVRSREVNSKLYLTYIKNVIRDKNSFIRDEVFGIVTDAVQTVSKPLLRELLIYCSNNYTRTRNLPVEPLIDELILHAVDYIAVNKLQLKETDDLGILINRLKNLYTASRMRDLGLLTAQKDAEKIVSKARLSKSDTMNSALKTTLQLYIVVRALTMNYYK